MTLQNQRLGYKIFELIYNGQILRIKADGYYRVFVTVTNYCNWTRNTVKFVTKKNAKTSLIEA